MAPVTPLAPSDLQRPDPAADASVERAKHRLGGAGSDDFAVREHPACRPAHLPRHLTASTGWVFSADVPSGVFATRASAEPSNRFRHADWRRARTRRPEAGGRRPKPRLTQQSPPRGLRAGAGCSSSWTARPQNHLRNTHLGGSWIVQSQLTATLLQRPHLRGEWGRQAPAPQAPGQAVPEARGLEPEAFAILRKTSSPRDY
jgi:hypothetical protein